MSRPGPEQPLLVVRQWGAPVHIPSLREVSEVGPEMGCLWQRIRLDCGWGGAQSIRRLFGDERTVPAVLEFLEDVRVGKMPGRILLAGGPDLEEESEGFSLQVPGERKGPG